MAITKASATSENPISNLLHRFRMITVGVFFLSFVTNVLMLTSPLFMLQVYDRVLSSRSVPTLVALLVLVAGLFIIYGLIEHLRSRVMARVGETIDDDLRSDLFDRTLYLRTASRSFRDAEPLSDLGVLRQFLSSPAPLAIFDMPWSPIYFIVLFMFHPWLGFVALGGGLFAIALTIVNELSTRANNKKNAQVSAAATGFLRAVSNNADVVTALGMQSNVKQRWLQFKTMADGSLRIVSDRISAFNTTSKATRFFLQSLILGVGAYLAILGETSPGTIIAGSILMGRALAPFDVAIGQWRQYNAAYLSYKRLIQVYELEFQNAERISLPALEGKVKLEGVFVGAPGGTGNILEGISFGLNNGDALGIVGPSASGKSTLARALVGLWPVARGSLQLDGAEIHLWNREDLGRQIGYLPQEVNLIRGTIKDNICRFDPNAADEDIIRAAQQAEVHSLITEMPQGYETEVGEGASYLSGGQRQRIGLARALYGDPRLVVLDEPNSNLDAEGDKALNIVIRKLRDEGRTVVIIAHRPSATQELTHLLYLHSGRVVEFGLRDDVLAKIVPKAPSQGQVRTTNG